MNKTKGLLQGQKVNPATQEQFDMFIANGLSIIHERETTDAILNQIQSNPDPIDAIAKATLDIVVRLEDSAAANGMKLEDSTKIAGANQLMGEIINLVEVSGGKKLADEQKYQAFSLAVSMYLDGAVKSGKMTKEQLVQMGQEAQQTPEGQKIAAQMQQGQQGQPPMQQGQPQGQPVQQPARRV